MQDFKAKLGVSVALSIILMAAATPASAKSPKTVNAKQTSIDSCTHSATAESTGAQDPAITLCREQILGTLFGDEKPAAEDDIGAKYLAAGHYGLAVSHYLKLYQQDPRNASTLNGLGIAYDKIGRFDLSERFYKEALKLNPQNAAALNNLGYSLLLQRRPHEAKAILQNAAQTPAAKQAVANNLKMAVRLTNTAPVEKPAPLLVRVSQNAQKLIVKPDPAMLRAAREADVNPRLAAVVSRGARPPVIHIITRPTPPRSTIQVQQSEDLQATLEISNGAGITGMAARMRGHLKQAGVKLTNAAHFGFTETTLFYHPDRLQEAQKLAKTLPFKVTLVSQTDLSTDLRLRLGQSAASFDAQLQGKVVLSSHRA